MKSTPCLPFCSFWYDKTNDRRYVQHKQSHVIELTDAGSWTGNIIALPNNRVRTTSPALWETGEGAPDFKPSQWMHNAESDGSYMDPSVTFDNLYSKD